MRWFGGFAPRNHMLAASVPALRPDAASHLWSGPAPLWLAGCWAEHEVRMARAGNRRVAIIGVCAATPPELQYLAATRVDDGALARWPGSYTVVEVTRERTTIWTNLGSASPIYTVEVEDGTVWASSSRALAPLARGVSGGVNLGVNLFWLAAMLLVPSTPELLAGRSAFEGVTALAPGHRLTLPIGGPPSQRPAWRPPRRAHIDIGEGAPALRRALHNAVKARVEHVDRLSADCSGGLDSTSLTLLAAELVGEGKRVQAITVHPAGVETGGDLTYALKATSGNPRIAHHLLPLAAEHAPYSRLGLLPATDEPAPSTVTISRTVAELDLLRALGSDCHLAGDGGDTILGSHPAYLSDLVRARRFGRLLRDATGWARMRRSSVWPQLADLARARRISRAARLRVLADTLTAAVGDRKNCYPSSGLAEGHGRASDKRWATAATGLLAAEMARAAADAANDDSSREAEEGTLLTLAAIQTVGRTAHADVQVAEAFGVPLHNPFTDTSVIDASLAVVTWQRMSPHAYKPLLVAAMKELLPPAVAARRTKGDFTPDHYLGLRANADRLHALSDGRLAALGLVDPPGLQHAIAHASAGLPADFSAFEPVIAAEAWLRAIADAPPIRWSRMPPGTTPIWPSDIGLPATGRMLGAV